MTLGQPGPPACARACQPSQRRTSCWSGLACRRTPTSYGASLYALAALCSEPAASPPQSPEARSACSAGVTRESCCWAPPRMGVPHLPTSFCCRRPSAARARRAAYRCVHVAATLAYWSGAPGGVLVIAILCAGDGLADIVGRRLGRRVKWPHNRDKVRRLKSSQTRFPPFTVPGVEATPLAEPSWITCVLPCWHRRSAGGPALRIGAGPGCPETRGTGGCVARGHLRGRGSERGEPCAANG